MVDSGREKAEARRLDVTYIYLLTGSFKGRAQNIQKKMLSIMTGTETERPFLITHNSVTNIVFLYRITIRLSRNK